MALSANSPQVPLPPLLLLLLLLHGAQAGALLPA
jgi:hypothetical protein